MRNARLLTGFVFFAGLPMSLVMGTVAGDLTRLSDYGGRVTFNGRPVDGGMIYFESIDRSWRSDLVARLDRDGHFTGVAEWPQDASRRAPFRLHFYPDRKRPGNAGLVIRPENQELEFARYERRSRGAGGERSDRPGEPANPIVWIGPEPIRIDIDLRD